MGKIIKDGFTFMEYVNSRLIRKIDDIPELKNKLIMLSESKTHLEMAQYALLLGEHILNLSGIERFAAVDNCFATIAKWQAGEAKFQEARDIAGILNELARDEKDAIRAKALRALGQVAATPHVRWHALAASEYAIVIINLMYPQNMDKVRGERELQIRLMEQASA